MRRGYFGWLEMPADKPFQFSLRSLLLWMALAAPLTLMMRRIGQSITLLAIGALDQELAISYGVLLTGILCLGATVSTVLVIPVLLTIIHTKRWLRRRRSSQSRDGIVR
jgi:hypothetical protein